MSAQLRKNSKNSKSEVKEQLTVNIAEVNKTKYNVFNNVSMFSDANIVDTVVTIDNSKINKVDVMSMSRVAFFRKLVLLDATFDTIAIYDFRFYNKTNDRSKTQHDNKYKNDQLDNDYVRMRTAKQLRDVLKERNIVDYLNKRYNNNYNYYTVSQYKTLIK